MGNALSSEPPQLYARPAPSTATAATHTEVATLELLASAYPPLHAREVEPTELLAVPAEIADGVYLGNFEHARDRQWLARAGIAAVLNCAPDVCRLSAREVPEVQSEQTSSAAQRVTRANAFYGPGVEYAECDATDCEGYPIVERHLKEAIAFISEQKQRGPVLIHCFSGQNRSAALALGYRMATQKLTFQQALSIVHPLRPIILSNESFRLQLLRLEYSPKE
eukprot:COSAG02_NODE_702_length_18327_cov_85.154597_10_plen_223_part_00